jgi:hypothetical protein
LTLYKGHIIILTTKIPDKTWYEVFSREAAGKKDFPLCFGLGSGVRTLEAIRKGYTPPLVCKTLHFNGTLYFLKLLKEPAELNSAYF